MSNFMSGLPVNLRLQNASTICPSCYIRKGRVVVRLAGQEQTVCVPCRYEHGMYS